MRKKELIERIRAAHAAFDATLVRLNESQLTRVGVVGDWSVKDVIVHLTTWQSLQARWLKQAARGEDPDRPKTWPEGYTETFNNQIYEKNKGRPLPRALEDLHLSCERVLAAVELLKDDDLNDANRYAWLPGMPLANLVAGNTYEHFAEHCEAIRAWMEKK